MKFTKGESADLEPPAPQHLLSTSAPFQHLSTFSALFQHLLSSFSIGLLHYCDLHFHVTT